ncbi:hypothetical protein JHK87_009820 [Glycine soja]|nr:hypothetical protein JHK87_009820 [Glycine soja]
MEVEPSQVIAPSTTAFESWWKYTYRAKKIANGEDEDSSESESDDDSSEDQIEARNNTGIDSSKKTLVSVKKTKFVTPQKTNSKNVGYVATPHPSKQTGKPTLLITSSRLRSQEITAATLTTVSWERHG